MVNFGDLNVLYSTSNGKGVNEQLLIQENFLTEVIISLRLVDSDNTIDTAIINMNNPNFTPDVDITFPFHNGFINVSDFGVLFNSITDQAEAIFDGLSLGQIESGYLLSNIDEGIHNLTLIEENSFTNQIDVTTVIFTVDLTVPVLVSDLSNLDNASFDTLVEINYTASDNFALESIVLIVGGRIGPSINIDGASSNGQLTLIPSQFENGLQTVKLILFDKARNSVTHQIEVTLTHSIFIIPLADIESEIENPIKSIIWEANSLNQDIYVISINDSISDTASWSTNNIIFNVPSTSNWGLYY